MSSTLRHSWNSPTPRPGLPHQPQAASRARLSMIRPGSDFKLAAVITAAALCLLTVGCASSGPEPPTRRSLPAALPELDQRTLLILMADQRRFDPLAVASASGGSTELRRLTALTLGRVGDVRGLATLDSLLADPEPQVRRAAAFALGLLAERGHAVALASLKDAVADGDRQVGITAVEGLARAGTTLEDTVQV